MENFIFDKNLMQRTHTHTITRAHTKKKNENGRGNLIKLFIQFSNSKLKIWSVRPKLKVCQMEFKSHCTMRYNVMSNDMHAFFY